MTKTTSKLVDTIIPVDAPATAAPSPTGAAKPYALTVIGPTVTAMAQICVHMRNGYIANPDTPIEVFPAAGTIAMVLVLGNPEQYAIDAAATTTADEVARERGRYLRDVEQAAARQIEEAAKAAAASKRTAFIAEQRKALAALEAEIAAAQ